MFISEENEKKSVEIKTESQRRGSDNTRRAGKKEKTTNTAGNIRRNLNFMSLNIV